MTPEDFEHYKFLRLCSIDFDTAKHVADVIARHAIREVQFPLLENLAVTYCRPFSGNNGVLKKKHYLDPHQFVPTSLRPLHDKLRSLRNTLFAHSDVSFHAPRVMVNIGTPEQPCHPMSFKGGGQEDLLAKLVEIRTLVEAVEQRVHAEVARIQSLPGFA